MKKEQARIKTASQVQPAKSQGTGDPLPADAAPDTITDAARKRLEARITEFGLDRSGVKKYVKDTFGKDHFKDMTKDEYEKLDQLIEIRAAKAELKAAQSEDV